MQVEEIEQLLLQLPNIVALEEHQPAAFIARVTMWMDLLEQALLAAGAYQAGQVAVLRGRLVFARHTAARDSVEPRAQLTRVKRLAVEASKALADAAAIATALIDAHRPRFADAEHRLTTLVAQARASHVLDAALPFVPTRLRLGEARRAIAGRRSLERLYSAVEGLVGPDDALFMLGRALGEGPSARIPNGRQQSADQPGEHG